MRGGAINQKGLGCLTEQREWRQHVIGTLEVVNVECHAIHAELMGIFQALEYVVEVVYHHYVVGSETSMKSKVSQSVRELRGGRGGRLVW